MYNINNSFFINYDLEHSTPNGKQKKTMTGVSNNPRVRGAPDCTTGEGKHVFSYKVGSQLSSCLPHHRDAREAVCPWTHIVGKSGINFLQV